MNGILGFIELLQNPSLSIQEQDKYMKILKISSQRLLNTISDIVEISRIEAGQASPALQFVNLKAMMKDLADTFHPQASEKGLQFILQEESLHEEVKLYTDRGKLESILTHFLRNAVKFTAEGTIRAGVTEESGGFVFFVCDTGIGISPDRHQAIFDRFVHADLKINRPFEGSGLGLSIALAYAGMLGGRIWLESEPGKGSTFYLSIPSVLPANNHPQITESDISSSGNERNLILIVEDDPANFLFLNTLLHKEGYRTLRAVSGPEALEIIQAEPALSLVLMDIRIPLMNGYEATKKIQQIRPGLPVVAQTAYAMSGDREKALQAGCIEYLSKPIRKETLLPLLKNILHK